MKRVAIVQARMHSTRLPGKVMTELAGKPMLYYVVHRARQASNLDMVAVATSDQPADDIIAQYCGEIGIPFFRGSLDDVLDRYYQAARWYSADVIVRLTADCPLIDPGIIDRVVGVFQAGNYDYVSNIHNPTYPDGLDTETFTLQAIERAWREATLKSEREHVTSYIWKHPNLFHLANVENDIDLSALRWTVDEPQDLEFVRRIYHYLGPTSSFGMIEVLALLRKHPDLNGVNAEFERNEGYHKSLREDAPISE